MQELNMFIVYRDPAGRYVVRRWSVHREESVLPRREEVVAVTDTLDEARQAVPAGLVRIGPVAFDDPDPVIIETWM